MKRSVIENLPAPIVVGIRGDDLENALSKEWLLTNRIGAYASSTALGCNTRRYHGLLIAATSPPVARIAALSTVMEQLTIGGQTYHLATNEFPDAFSPRGFVHLVEFRNDVAATFVFRAGDAELIKEIILADAANVVAVRYTLRGAEGKLRLAPFVALRDYHGMRKADQAHQMTFETADAGVSVHDRMLPGDALHLVSHEAKFTAEPQWWYRFRYRADIARGQDGQEDLYTPGSFEYELADGRPCQLTASLSDPVPLGFETTLNRRRVRLAELAGSVGPDADETTRRLGAASDAFVVQRSFPGQPPRPTILAGFPWFADWGRDVFIALPGLLLVTERFDTARGVFLTFAQSVSEGMIPNRFDDYSTAAHYNSIDASLWFIVAAERYLAATGDTAFWRSKLMPVANTILSAYHEGTRFDIHADADALLVGGTHKTQLTWMDTKLADEVVTPRHGKAVEINALWYCAHRIMADRCRGIDDELADGYAQRAEMIARSFVRTFWNARDGCLYDCVNDGTVDASLRPNQIFAVSLPHSPLSGDQQASVVRVVSEKLLTPMGLRTLSPDDDRYRRRYGGSWESRDRAYHQGTVWAYLIGPFVEALLKVEGAKPSALAQAHKCLEAFDAHLSEAGLGFVSEVFDGDPPHSPRGCFAQAWSVAEVLRAKKLIGEYRLKS